MKISSININGLNPRDVKFVNLMTFLRDEKVDLVLITESHLNDERLALIDFRGHEDWTIISNSPSSNQKGLTFILFNRPGSHLTTMTETYRDDAGRALSVEIKVGTAPPVGVLGIYAPTSNAPARQIDFYKALQEQQLRVDYMLGDFNMVEDTIDRNPQRSVPADVAKEFRSLTKGFALIDGWRLENEEVKQYTWHRADGTSSSRIDRIYASPGVIRKCIKWEITPMHLTDHEMVSVEWYPHDKINMGKGLWTLSPAYLEAPEMREVILEDIAILVDAVLPQWELQNDSWYTPLDASAPLQAIEAFSAFLNRVQTHCKVTQKGLMGKKHLVIDRLRKAMRRVEARTRSRANAQRIHKLRGRYIAYQESVDYTRRLRRRIGFETGKEIGLRAFYKLTSKGTDRQVHALADEKGKIHKKPEDLLKIGASFYEKLFTAEPTCPRSRVQIQSRIRKKGDFTGLEAPVRISEIETVLKHWGCETVPGPDGIPYEFYKTYAKDTRLKEVLTIVMTSIYQKDKFALEMPKKWKEGVIKILFKKGDSTLMANYRPLSMMNSIAKMFTSLLNNRLIPRFCPLIGAHQTGFLPGRNILENVKEAQVLLDVAELKQKPIYLVLLDQEKAYDRVDHTYLWGCLRAFGVPRWMIEVIKGYYKDTTSMVSINRHLSAAIQLTRGARQGCPLSCLLFNIAIEPFALLLIESSRDLPGWINESNIRHIVRMFADDTMVVLTSLSQWRVLLRLYGLYAKASGGKLNIKKTEIVSAGVTGEPEVIDGIEVSYRRAARYLGIPIGVEIDLEDFWYRLLCKVKNRIDEWQKVYLGLEGRIQVSKNCLDGMLWYFVRCLPITELQITAFREVVDRYIWARTGDQKTEAPIALQEVTRPRNEGGLNTMDISTMVTSLNMYWIQQMDLQLDFDVTERKSWTIVATEIMLFHAPAHVKKIVTRPWDQWWGHQELKVKQQSISHFWSRWVLVGRERQLEPETLRELLAINFWYHPEFKSHGKNRPRHANGCWLKMLSGEGLQRPIITVQDLIQVSLARVAGTNQAMERAARQLVQLFPSKWKTLIGDNLEDPSLCGPIAKRFRQTAISNKFGATLPLAGTENKPIYTLLKRNLLYKKTSDVKDLLDNFRKLCERDGVTFSNFPARAVWSSTRDREVDYPKFSDLYWKLVHGRVRCGEEWMGEFHLCPECKVPQTVEHLFWDCPIAVSSWRHMADTFAQISDTKCVLPTSWAALLLWGCSGRKTYRNTIDRKRWRTLFGLTFWAMWKSRSGWSHDGGFYSMKTVRSAFNDLLTQRVRVSRLQYLNLRDQGPLKEHSAIWAYSPHDTDTPPWLEGLLKVQDLREKAVLLPQAFTPYCFIFPAHQLATLP